jgi:hypothetical protein
MMYALVDGRAFIWYGFYTYGLYTNKHVSLSIFVLMFVVVVVVRVVVVVVRVVVVVVRAAVVVVVIVRIVRQHSTNAIRRYLENLFCKLSRTVWLRAHCAL